MKNFIPIFLISLILLSCSSTKKSIKANTTVEQPTTSASSEIKDGSSYESAIFIDETSETNGVTKEYEWLKKNYPGYQTLGQSLTTHKGKPYDIIKIKTADGNQKSFYFDISKFFGKY